MPLIANRRFERYNRGDTIALKDEERFRGTYPQCVIEVSDEDLSALDKMASEGKVGQWIDEMCKRPSLKGLRDEKAAQEKANAAKAEAAKAQAAAKAPEPVASTQSTADARRSGRSKRRGDNAAQKAKPADDGSED